ncbi:MAG: 50S ribosomal protein L32e [Nanoarchaeota archaeon]|nr:50S ribosomal protein L32e [Nanoarchaeota archaeon]
MKMKKKKFIRTDSNRFSKIGRKRKKLQKWRRPKGRDNKMREKRFGYPRLPTVGQKTPKKEIGKIRGMKPYLVYNVKDLDKTNKKTILIIGRVGAKKRLEIIKKALEMKLKISNIKNLRKENETK